ncbi:hypothetical protein PLICRDRAFT_646394 [Plicaturopsis crispa FD-325 SS-3]|nr:hypothetical protein PLICRDRAFT_646394 [Plicaturopsis crispa FD-325 SS-3]
MRRAPEYSGLLTPRPEPCPYRSIVPRVPAAFSSSTIRHIRLSNAPACICRLTRLARPRMLKLTHLPRRFTRSPPCRAAPTWISHSAVFNNSTALALASPSHVSAGGVN